MPAPVSPSRARARARTVARARANAWRESEWTRAMFRARAREGETGTESRNGVLAQMPLPVRKVR